MQLISLDELFPESWNEVRISLPQSPLKRETLREGKGFSTEGIEIRMFLKADGTNQIISAFPIF